MSTRCEVRVPDIGDFKDIPVIEILVKPGDLVHVEQAVVTLESEKATLDVPSSSAGRVATVAVSPGTRVSAGSLILTLELDSVEAPADSTEPKAAVIPSAVPQVQAAAASLTTSPPAMPKLVPVSPRLDEAPTSSRIYAGPSVRRLGRQLGADLARVTGSGRGGRILAEDVHDSVRKELQESSARPLERRPVPRIDFSKYGEIERQPLSRIRRISGPVLAHNWATIPHVTNFDEADVTELEPLRIALNKEFGGNPKLTLLSFLVKAVASTLQQTPAFNASLDGDDLIVKKYINIGVAVDTPGGLVVPVLRNVDKLGVLDIARQLSEKSALAQAGKLKPADFEGGSFTISSLGGVGGTGFTPIINAPEIAILGVSRATIQPRYDGSQFVPRLMLPLSLSWDHRATDGVAAARFLVKLASLLHNNRMRSSASCATGEF
jgi:pyruvate dehydrogenase E2 component (dihydrolipoamide acetyltransferase)